MLDPILAARLFLVGFVLNLIWEFAHCQLYETCRRQSWAKNVPLLVTMSLKDGFFIVLLYLITAALWQTANILRHPAALACFIFLALVFSFLDEKISVKRGRWEYASAMPTLFGVGITPLLEIAVTGLLALVILSIF